MKIKVNKPKNVIYDMKLTLRQFIGTEVYNINSKKTGKILDTSDNKINVQYEDSSIEENLDIECFFFS